MGTFQNVSKNPLFCFYYAKQLLTDVHSSYWHTAEKQANYFDLKALFLPLWRWELHQHWNIHGWFIMTSQFLDYSLFAWLMWTLIHRSLLIRVGRCLPNWHRTMSTVKHRDGRWHRGAGLGVCPKCEFVFRNARKTNNTFYGVGVCTNSRTFEYWICNYYSNNKNTIWLLLCVNLLAVNAGNPW